MAFSYDRLRAGLGATRNALLPIPEEVASQLDPRTLEALRKQAVLQMGLGMMGASEKGAGLGTGALFGLNQAQQGLGQGVNQAWMGQRAAREDRRVEQNDRRIELQMERDQARDTESRRRYEEQTALERARMAADEARWRVGLGNTATDNARAEQSLAIQKAQARLSGAEAAHEAAIEADVLAISQALAENPSRRDAAKLKARYKAYTGREFDPKDTLSPTERLVADALNPEGAQAPATATAPGQRRTATDANGNKVELIDGKWVPVGGASGRW